MPQPGRPPLRVRVALVAACYASIWLAGAVHHAARCPDTPRPHCTLCACVSTTSLVSAPATHMPVLADRGSVVQSPRPGPQVVATADGVTRAPPDFASQTSF